MAINIIDEYVDINYKDRVNKVRIPTMEESDIYAENYDNAESRKEKREVLKNYLIGLGMEEEIYSKMRDTHLHELIGEFSAKKN